MRLDGGQPWVAGDGDLDRVAGHQRDEGKGAKGEDGERDGDLREAGDEDAGHPSSEFSPSSR